MRKRKSNEVDEIKKYRARINWNDEQVTLRALVKINTSVQIAKIYGVSRQRIFQVLRTFDIDTPEQQRDRLLKGKSPKYHWVNRMLTLYSETISKKERLEFLENGFIPDVCPILGIELKYYSSKGKMENSPSLSRLDLTKPFVINNICIISVRASRIRNDGTAEEHRLIYEYMLKKSISN